MAYIGKSIESGTFAVLDTSGNTYNGSNTTFSLGTQVGSASQLLVSHDGVIQKPGTDYTLASGGASITFSTAPASGASIFIVEISGAVGGTVTPSDNSVGVTQLNLSDGSNGQFIKTDGSGTLSFATVDTSSATDSFTISGSTPTLTVGDAGAEDTKIVFDGNAQDFHIGLDDSADDLLIGLGSTLGTTTHMAFDEAGHITKPLQSCSLARIGTNESINFSSMTDLKFDTEIFDQNADFNTSNYTFTAPVTGRYLVNAMTGLAGYGNAAELNFRIDASNRDFDIRRFGMNGGGSGGNVTIMTGSVLVDMDASDTVKLRLEVASGTSVEVYPERSCFSVLLVA